MTRAYTTADWSRLMFDASWLWADAAQVAVFRSWRVMAGGRPAEREIERMLSEKVAAGFELAGAFAGGLVQTPESAARKALGVYGRRVHANRKRLR